MSFNLSLHQIYNKECEEDQDYEEYKEDLENELIISKIELNRAKTQYYISLIKKINK